MKNKLYNVFFPVWFLLILPITWLYALPINFIVDTLVVLISLKVMKAEGIKNIYKKSILKVWIFGFIADIIGSLVLLITLFFPENEWLYKITSAISWNPFENIFALIYVFIAIFIAGICIYFFNKKISLKKVELDEKKKKKLALVLAIVTAPYLFLLPSSLLYKSSYDGRITNYTQDQISTQKANSEFINFVKDNSDTYLGDTKITRIFAKSNDYTNEFTSMNIYTLNETYEIDTDNLTLIVNVELDPIMNLNDQTDFTKISMWIKRRSAITIALSQNTNQVTVNIKSGEDVKTLEFKKEDLENKNNVNIDELKYNIEKFEEFISSIK